MRYSNFSLEKALLERGYSLVAGMDEAGRGCLAGPLVAAVVVISGDDQFLPGVWDSKLMTAGRREAAYDRIVDVVDGYGIGEASSDEVFELGLSKAGVLAMRRAYGRLAERPDVVLVDGRYVRSPSLSSLKIKEGDQKHFVISAASVLAKVYRDRLMHDYASEYPEYGFETNVGYGTRKHLAALEKYGICALHRRNYSPVRRLIERGRGDGGGQ